MENKKKIKMKMEECIEKHLNRAVENIYEYIKDIGISEENMETAKMLEIAKKIEKILLDNTEYKGNTARIQIIFRQLIEAEYHAYEHNKIELAKEIRKIREELKKIVTP